ncbi:hypothetical protein XENOCAPTIV_030965 [Xenoophorus captivus]|uniref:GPI ethanolamine phosphate transferase 1 n=1 Tax=Xenoophorus captivus TaxID=1517983 RepID=A0ABV0Q449_9TELE
MYSISCQISLCQSLVALSLEGLVYYHTYDRFFLGCSVVLGFLGWTSYVLLVILRTHASLVRYPNLAKQVGTGDSNPSVEESFHNSWSGALSDLIQSAPSLPLWKCLGYFVLVAFGIELLVGVFKPVVSDPRLYCTGHLPVQRLFVCSLTTWLGLLFVICCPQVVSFFHRAMLTVGLAFLSVWPLLSGLFGKAKVTDHVCVLKSW